VLLAQLPFTLPLIYARANTEPNGTGQRNVDDERSLVRMGAMSGRCISESRWYEVRWREKRRDVINDNSRLGPGTKKVVRTVSARTGISCAPL